MTTNINLLPWREEKRERNKRFFLIGLGVSATVSFVIAIITFVVLNNHIDYQTERNKLIEGEIARYNRQIAEIKKLKATRASLIARMNVIQQLQENRPEIVHFFDELVKVVPKSIYLLVVERIGDDITLTGHTDVNSSVSLLMRRINANFWLNKPVLEEVAEVTNKKKTALYNQFRLKVILKPLDKLQANEDQFDG